MMDLQRICVKFFCEPNCAPKAEEAFRIFDSWMRDTPGEVLIDVADYRHVGQGPLVVLVGHEADRAYDNTGGRSGLLYSRKRDAIGAGDPPLTAALKAALSTCVRFEEAAPGVRFLTNEFLLIANDRLVAPNTDSSLEAIRPELNEALGRLFGGNPFSFECQGDPGERLSLRVASSPASDTSALLERLAS